MKIISQVFKNNERIPKIYTCDGENINPPLEFYEIPKNAKSLCLIVDDPVAPLGTFTHWIVWNIPPTITEIKENSIPIGGSQGFTSFKKIGYGGPCPPKGSEHKYYFRLYALNDMVDLPDAANEEEAKDAIKMNVIAKAELIGKYSR
ncbi:MAG: YbhB/YbcL family Raf kinase inhibitor-like protein [bacterium]